eukprot:3761296-Pyramimonas_sp.AAC.1
MRTSPLWPSVELTTRCIVWISLLQSRRAILGAGDACEHRHLGLRWSSPLRPRNAVLGGGNARGHRHRGLRWSSP